MAAEVGLISPIKGVEAEVEAVALMWASTAVPVMMAVMAVITRVTMQAVVMKAKEREETEERGL
jgi:hypothetical protein